MRTSTSASEVFPKSRMKPEANATSLGTSNPVSFKPYLDRFEKNLNNQYYLVFLGEPKKKGTLQRIKVWTEKPNSEIAAPDNVWVPGLEDKDNDKNR